MALLSIKLCWQLHWSYRTALHRKNLNNSTVCYAVRSSLLWKVGETQQKHSPFPLSEAGKGNTGISRLCWERKAQWHSIRFNFPLFYSSAVASNRTRTIQTVHPLSGHGIPVSFVPSRPQKTIFRKEKGLESILSWLGINYCGFKLRPDPLSSWARWQPV